MFHSDKNQLGKQALSALLWSISGAGTQAILRFIVLIILARLIGPEQFGIISAALIVISLAQLFSTMGVGPAIIQKKDITSKILSNGFIVSNILGLLCMLLLILTSDFIAIFFQIPELSYILKVLAFIFPISALATTSESILQRNLDFKAFVIRDTISYVFAYGFIGISLAYMEYGAWSIIVAHLIQALLKTTIILIYQPLKISLNIDKSLCINMLKFGAGISSAKIANFFAAQVDNIIAIKILGTVQLGIYNRAFQFIAMPASLLGGELSKVLFSAISSIQNQKKRIQNTLQKSISLVFLISTPLTVIIIFLSESIIILLLGSAWIKTVLPMQILAITLPFRTAYRIDNAIANGLGSVYPRAWREFIYFITVLFSCYIGAIKYGIEGIAIGASLAALINFILMHQLSLKLVNESWKITVKTIFFNLVLITPMIFTFILCKFFIIIHTNKIISDFIFTLISISIYIITLYFFRKKIIDEINWLKNKIGK